jgi:hypothetical protein
MHFSRDYSVGPVLTKSSGTILDIRRVARRVKARDGFHKSSCMVYTLRLFARSLLVLMYRMYGMPVLQEQKPVTRKILFFDAL